MNGALFQHNTTNHLRRGICCCSCLDQLKKNQNLTNSFLQYHSIFPETITNPPKWTKEYWTIILWRSSLVLLQEVTLKIQVFIVIKIEIKSLWPRPYSTIIYQASHARFNKKQVSATENWPFYDYVAVKTAAECGWVNNKHFSVDMFDDYLNFEMLPISNTCALLR